jgi:hypothetical protein
LCQGKADYVPTPGFEDRWHVIGEGDNPVYICKKGDVPKLFDSEFFFFYEVWKYYHCGFGLPDGMTVDKGEPEIMEALLQMEWHYRANFDYIIAVIKYQEAILKALSARGGM